MSLITDKVFFNALQASASIVSATDGRIYNTSVPVPDEQLDNEPLPYIVITFDGLTNEGLTKDSSYEGEDDRVQIGILVVAAERESLGELTEAVRKQVKDYFEAVQPKDADFDLVPADYTFSASPIQFDWMVPCHYQTLTYNCDTTP